MGWFYTLAAERNTQQITAHELPMTTLQLVLAVGSCLLALIALVSIVVAWHSETNLLAMRETPTLSVAAVLERYRAALSGAVRFGEPVEVVGTIECDTPLQAPYSETRCIAYDYSVSEEHEQPLGVRGRRGSYEIETNNFDQHDRRVPHFYVRDASGRIAVDPADAQIDMLETVARYEAYTGLRGSERQIWREERALPLGNRVYVLGYLGNSHGEPTLMRHPLQPGRRFLISHRDERSLASRTRWRSYGLYLAGGLSGGGAAALLVAAYLLR